MEFSGHKLCCRTVHVEAPHSVRNVICNAARRVSIVLAAITWAGCVAASAASSIIASVLGFLAAGSTVTAIAELVGVEGLRVFGGWLFIIAAVIAWYAATALMINSSFGRRVWEPGVPKMGSVSSRGSWLYSTPYAPS